MNYAAILRPTKQKLSFKFQDIVDFNGQPQGWVEMLYRPNSLQGQPNVEKFFKSLTQDEKVALDIAIFSEIEHVLNNHNAQRISVNLTPLSLSSSRFRNHMLDLINNRQITPNRMCIEFTEIDQMSTLSHETIELIQHFKAHGGWIALDDFGSGFAHWELLRLKLVNVIKVASQNLQDEDIGDFIQGLSRLASHLKINSVLEGVETEADFKFGQQQGFNNFQGWYFG
jgi:EAL domain-containing protein (putative c-di-GMP-specific phosphodiesterase class I)